MTKAQDFFAFLHGFASKDVAEIQAILQLSASFRVIGSLHCFNKISDADELISLRHMKPGNACALPKQGCNQKGKPFPIQFKKRGILLHGKGSLKWFKMDNGLSNFVK